MNVGSPRMKRSFLVSGTRQVRAPRPAPATPAPLRHQGTLRTAVATYVVALLVIAAFSVALYFVTDRIVTQQGATARVVNLSGRQRMLSNRVVRLSLERAAHTPFRSAAETEAELTTTIVLLAETHESLLHGSEALGIRSPVPEVLRVYTSAPYNLNAQMAAFLGHARSLASHPENELTLADKDLAAVEQAVQGQLLEALSAAVAAKQETSEASIRQLRALLGRMTLGMLAILLAEALFLYRPLFKRLALVHAELLEQGRTDPLTGCLNRRAFTQEAHALVEESKKAGRPMAVLMIDIDRFKSVNDRFGHTAGDDVIHDMVTRILGDRTSPHRLCRMGGEEFSVLLRGMTLEQAVVEAETFRRVVEATAFVVRAQEETLEVEVTISVGVAELMATDESIFTVLTRADKALYRAKQDGRNRVEMERYALPAVAVMGTRGQSKRYLIKK